MTNLKQIFLHNKYIYYQSIATYMNHILKNKTKQKLYRRLDPKYNSVSKIPLTRALTR